MARKQRNPNFDQLLDALRAHGFEVTPSAPVAESVQVSKNGVAAILAPGQDASVLIERPGVLVQGEIASLFDRGYQKFLKTRRFELPATADALHAMHAFHEELKLLAGSLSQFNESLGTTSDLYHYDRVLGRETAEPAPVRPWEPAAGH
jgi:hypothetical protein